VFNAVLPLLVDRMKMASYVARNFVKVHNSVKLTHLKNG
jgi:hypothetical protein